MTDKKELLVKMELLKQGLELNNKQIDASIVNDAIDYISNQVEPLVINTPEKFAPTLAEISKRGELGKEGWWEVVYHDGVNWQHFAGSDTFDDGEKVVRWKLCRECL